MNYETLLIAAKTKSIDVYEVDLKGKIKGLYKDGIVWISKGLGANEKRCILAEEIGHHETSVGDILDQADIRNRKQELQAKQWAYFSTIPLSAIVQAQQSRLKGRHEIAEFLNVTEEFLQAAVDRYKEKYGLLAVYDDRYIVCFDPLGVIEIFE